MFNNLRLMLSRVFSTFHLATASVFRFVYHIYVKEGENVIKSILSQPKMSGGIFYCIFKKQEF